MAVASSFPQFKRLRPRSLREIRERGRQQIAKFGERLRSSSSLEMSDAELFSQFRPEDRNGTGEGTTALIIDRIKARARSANHKKFAPAIFPSLSSRDEIAAISKERFADESQAIIDRANRAALGRFDLLGYRDLTFGEQIDWHLEPVSGKRAPLDHWSQIDYLNPEVAGDKKIIWELNRHAHFVTFGQAYWLTNDERYAEAFVAQATGWMDANPPKQGINWASSLELAFRSIAWLWALHLFAGSSRLSPKFVARLIKNLVAQGRHIESYLSYYFSPNTHLTGEALGLFYLGTALPELNRASNWQAAGLGILVEQLPKQIQPDGVYFEQSTYYHRYTADFYIHLIKIAREKRMNLSAGVEERLALALDHLMWITRPDNTSPFVGDDDGGRLISFATREADDFRDTLGAGAALFGRSDWKFVAGSAPVELLWLLGPDALACYDAIEAKTPIQNVRGFSNGGYFIMRDGWTDQSSYVLFDSGPHGSLSCGHAHSDALSIEYSTAGTTWLVDPGTVTYTGDDKLRDYFRSTEAHNTVTVDGESQSSSAGPFSWKHIAKSAAHEFVEEDFFTYIEGSQDGYKRLADPVMHARSVLFVKSESERCGCSLPPYLIVRDSFAANEKHDYAARFHFSPGVTARADWSSLQANDRRGNELNIRAFTQAGARSRIENGIVSRAYGRQQAAHVGVIEFDGKGPQELVTFLIPTITNSQSAVEQVQRSEAGFAFTVTSNGFKDLIATGDGKKEIKCDDLTARGALAWARFAGEEFTRGCMIRGKRLEIGGVFSIESPTSVRCCSVEIQARQVEITIHEGSRFDLSFSRPQQSVIVNKTRFCLHPNTRNAAFIREGSGWRLSKED